MCEEGKVDLIQLGSVGDGEFINKDYKHITEEKFVELKGKRIYGGYLLINRLIGDKMLSCMIPHTDSFLMTAVDICWIAPQNEYYNLEYLMYVLLSGFFQEKVKALGRGTTRFRVSKTNLTNILFPIPPLAEQRRIVAKIESLLPLCKQL